MSGVVRWLKFNLVGAMGVGVQLGALALFNRGMGGHYLWAAGAAVELAVVHNFLWHVSYTWRDRGGGRAGILRRFARFQLSNGMVSLVGNLILMRLLVHGMGLPLLAANVVSIVCCSVANFCFGDRWVFDQSDPLN